jgi:hypothetical protein
MAPTSAASTPTAPPGAQPADRPVAAGGGAAPRPTLTLGEVLVGTAVLIVAVIAESGLVLVHLRLWSLPAAVGVSATVVALVVAGAWRSRHRPAVRTEPAQLAALAAVGIIGAALFFPGFPAGMVGWDPGIYVNHGLAIAETGAVDLVDPVTAVEPEPPGTQIGEVRFPGLSASPVADGRSVPAFYHLYPALTAPAAAIAGERGVVNVNPLVAILTSMALLTAAWRAFGPLTGGLVGLLAATNMVDVWHARYPTTEALTQLLVVGAVLGVVLAAHTRWRLPAGAAGAATGLVFLARPDGALIVGMAVVGLAALAVAGRFDRRATWFAVGLVAVLPHALVQAYVIASQYTEGHIPRAGVLLGALAVPALTAVAVAVVRHRDPDGWAGAARRPLIVVDRAVAAASTRRGRMILGGSLVAVLTVVLVYNALRPLLGDGLPAGVDPNAAHAHYNRYSLIRLSWFLTPVGIVALWIGFAVTALCPWRLSRWVLVAPGMALLPLYLQQPRISTRLMWWTRRFVPYVWPSLLVLIAVALAAGLVWRGRGRLPVRATSAAATLVVVGSFLSMSLPLRGHHELQGSFAVYQEVAAAVPDDALVLWSQEPGPATGSADAFASTLVYRHDAVVSRLPAGAGDDEVEAWTDAFPDRPLYVVADGPDLPPPLAGLHAEPVARIETVLPIWELTFDERPDEPAGLPFDFTVWSVDR